MKIPDGDISSRPNPAKLGYIRYNTETQQFEGYGPGNAWGSLGGVIDIDRDTFWTALNDISGSEYPGDPDTLRAYVGHDNNPSETNGMLMMTISANKTIIHRPNVGIGTMNPQGELQHVSYAPEGVPTPEVPSYRGSFPPRASPHHAWRRALLVPCSWMVG